MKHALVLAVVLLTQSPAIDGTRLLADLQTLSSDAMEGRLTGTPGGERARDFVVGRFQESGIEPIGSSYLQPFTVERHGGGRGSGANVVGIVRGATRPDLYLVVSAHYDHLGVRNGVVFNGADDNASGVAALFALGAYFSKNKPHNSIVFVAFDHEELGGGGARTFLASPPVPKAAIALNVNMDMIARDEHNRLFAVGTYHYPFLKPYLERAGTRAPVRMLFGHDRPGEDEDWTLESDHGAFHRERIPFVYFGVEDFENHHRPSDDFETITREFYVAAVGTILDAVRVLDGNLAAVHAAAKR